MIGSGIQPVDAYSADSANTNGDSANLGYDAFKNLVQIMGLWRVPAIAEPILGADFFVAGHGARISYAIPNVKATIWHVNLPFETCMWRGVGMFANTFAMESFMDMLAIKAGVDPLQFRINHCGDTGQLARRKKLLKLMSQKRP